MTRSDSPFNEHGLIPVVIVRQWESEDTHQAGANVGEVTFDVLFCLNPLTRFPAGPFPCATW